MQQVLFLCSGNYYRSRWAEIYFNWLATQHAIPWRAVSRGLRLDGGNQGLMSPFTLARLASLPVGQDPYMRPPLDTQPHDLRESDLIVAVKESEHREMLQERFPDWIPQVEFWEIHDLDRAPPEQAFAELETAVAALVARLAQQQGVPAASTSEHALK